MLYSDALQDVGFPRPGVPTRLSPTSPRQLELRSAFLAAVGARDLGTIHEIRVQDLALSPTLTALCAAFESKTWRDTQLVDDIFYRHLASFALSFTEFAAIDGETAARSLRKAAQAVYDTDKYRSRGEFGELLLHAAAKDFFGAQPAVSKIFYKDSDNDTVKGFDCVHVVEANGELEIWLGEVKFYAELAAAIRDSAAELQDHLHRDFLRREFVAITNKLDPTWPLADRVRQLLDETTSLDQIVDQLVIPVMLTYDSPSIAHHDRLTDAYVADLGSEASAGWDAFVKKIAVPYPVRLHLILVPLPSKARLVNLMHQKLQLWKHL